MYLLCVCFSVAALLLLRLALPCYFCSVFTRRLSVVLNIFFIHFSILSSRLSTVADTLQLQAFNFYSELNFYRTCCCGIVSFLHGFSFSFPSSLDTLSILFLSLCMCVFSSTRLRHENTVEHVLFASVLHCDLYIAYYIEMHTIIFHLISLSISHARATILTETFRAFYIVDNNLCMCCVNLPPANVIITRKA